MGLAGGEGAAAGRGVEAELLPVLFCFKLRCHLLFPCHLPSPSCTLSPSV